MNARSTEPATEAPTTLVVKPAAPAAAYDELLRTRNFAAGSFIVCVLGIIGQWLNAGVGWPTTIARILVPVVALEAALVWYIARFKRRYPGVTILVYGITAMLCGTAIEVDVGIFSPIIAATVLGFPFYARTKRAVLVWSLCGVKVASYLTLALLITFDVIPDVGHFPSTGVSRGNKLAITLVVTAICVMSFLHGRLSRKSALESLALERTLALDAHRKDAQLEEARGDLEIALHAQRGKGGRYTGAVISGWTIGPLIGRGAMGEVYAARDANGTEAAIKILITTPGFEDPARIARFMREAKVTASLHSTSLVQVLAFGQTEDGTPFLVMERLDGEDLASHLRRAERLPLAEVVEMVDQLARGLRVAHLAGVVHRDLKPGNVFRCAADKSGSPRWAILDFGVCAEAGSSGTLTADGLVGTPQYMSPEQAVGDTVGTAADLFGLAAVIYRSLTGAPPFTGAGPPQQLYAIVHDAPMRPSDLARDLPPDIDRFLALALAKAPRDRFPDADAMALALRAAAKSELDPDRRKRADALIRKLPWKPLTR